MAMWSLPIFKLSTRIEEIHDVVFGTTGSRPLMLNIARPKTKSTEPMPVIVFIHGGG